MTREKNIPPLRVILVANAVLLLLANLMIGYRIYFVYTLFPIINLLLLGSILMLPFGIAVYVYFEEKRLKMRQMLMAGAAISFLIAMPLIFWINFLFSGPARQVYITPYYTSQNKFKSGELSWMRQFFANGSGTRIDEHNTTGYFAFGCYRQLRFSIPAGRVKIDSIGFSYREGMLMMPVFDRDTICSTPLENPEP